jgi:hypothetical protein
VLNSRHKLVTISEIVWGNDRPLKIIRMDIEFLYKTTADKQFTKDARRK